MTPARSRSLRVAVLGAAGTIAPAILRDLAVSEEVESMLLLDLDGERAAAAASAHGGGKSTSRAVDARNVDELQEVLEDADVLVNTASYRINLDAMSACLKSGCNYLDLGGLYWVTRTERELSPEFERTGLLAILGIGSAPGKTNLMAQAAVRELRARGKEIESIEVAAAGRDPVASSDGRLRPPYAIQTLLDELTLQPVVIRDDQPVQIEPLSDGGTIAYGDPIGRAETIFTLHSELATFAESFGCRNASFRLSLSPPLLAALKELVGTSEEEVAAAAREAAAPSNETVSVHLVTATAPDGERIKVRAVTHPHFGLGGSIVSTAAPAAASVRLLARGSLTATGALPPEQCIEAPEMFAELESRGCAFTVER
ncbi:MAG TPA: saccharopine dehydrogenase NADP-binding domain-containing protein [Solirubrobacteraceae bacterium]